MGCIHAKVGGAFVLRGTQDSSIAVSSSSTAAALQRLED